VRGAALSEERRLEYGLGVGMTVQFCDHITMLLTATVHPQQ
jgi:hypothetical protein